MTQVRLPEAEVACERGGLVADPLHEAAVAGDHPTCGGRIGWAEPRAKDRLAIAIPMASANPGRAAVVTSTHGVVVTRMSRASSTSNWSERTQILELDSVSREERIEY
jgi:hypothetical protein